MPTGTVDLVTTTVNPLQRRGDLACRGMNIAEIGVTIAAPRRRADRDEHGIGLGDGRGQIGGELQTAGLHIGGDERIEARLENGNFAAAQAGDLALVLVHAGDVVAEIREAGA